MSEQTVQDFSAVPAAPPSADIRDFSKPRKRVAFTIDGDVFEAPPVLPAMVLMEYTKTFNAHKDSDDPADQMASMTGVLELILRPASYKLFMARLSDPERPIDLEQLQQVIEFVMEEYGMRPTQLPSGSPDGQASPESGTNSQELSQAEVSISPPTPSTSS